MPGVCGVVALSGLGQRSQELPYLALVVKEPDGVLGLVCMELTGEIDDLLVIHPLRHLTYA
jgi:hypothetical protein